MRRPVRSSSRYSAATSLPAAECVIGQIARSAGTSRSAKPFTSTLRSSSRKSRTDPATSPAPTASASPSNTPRIAAASGRPIALPRRGGRNADGSGGEGEGSEGCIGSMVREAGSEAARKRRAGSATGLGRAVPALLRAGVDRLQNRALARLDRLQEGRGPPDGAERLEAAHEEILHLRQAGEA